MITTWRKELAKTPYGSDRPLYVEEIDGPLLAVAPNQSVLDEEFDSGFGTAEGPHFTAWTIDRVYFPVVYDGAEWVASAPRNPCDEAVPHVGGQ